MPVPFVEKMREAFAVQSMQCKSFSHFFQQKICIYGNKVVKNLQIDLSTLSLS